jgi:hypothetical protein
LENVEYSDGSRYKQPGNNMLYFWDFSKKVLLLQTINVRQDFLVFATYNKKRDKTVVKYREKGRIKKRTEYNGMKVIELSTNKGGLEYQP